MTVTVSVYHDQYTMTVTVTLTVPVIVVPGRLSVQSFTRLSVCPVVHVHMCLYIHMYIASNHEANVKLYSKTKPKPVWVSPNSKYSLDEIVQRFVSNLLDG